MIAPRAVAPLFALLAASCLAASAKDLPARIAPPPPFPAILTQAPAISDVAPGVTQADYALVTADGPVAIRVVAIAPHRSDLHFGAVLASDRLTSQGETVASMARRTGAVAGINADYFDINNTNRPTNVVVRQGRLLRTPRRRYALAIAPDGTPRFAEFAFSGTLAIGPAQIGLDAVNEYPPPNGGTAILTPEFGVVGPQANVTLVGLQPLDGTPPFARYRVTGIVDNGTAQPAGTYLAVGPNAYGVASVPNAGDVVVASGDFASGDLAQIATALGGGPLILHAGAWFDDPDGPGGGEFLTRIPSTGAAIAPDGTLFLIEVDGRQPEISIGVTRPQFAAIMRALGATEGMAFDGGGSSTIVARDLGDADATLQNAPSDGRERPVADGLFVYSDASGGSPRRMVARPSTIRAMPGAIVPVSIASIDAADRPVAASGALRVAVAPASLGTFAGGRFVARAAGRGVLRFARGGIAGIAPLVVVDRPARLAIVPNAPNVSSGERLRLTVRAFDKDGYPVALPAALSWKATAGTIDAKGTYTAGATNATVSVRAGSVVASTAVTVGRHEDPLQAGPDAHLVTSPRGGPGSLALATPCPTCLTLAYDFTGTERAAYATLDAPLPAGALGIAFDADGAGSGTVLRVAFVNAIDERVLVTATTLDFSGFRRFVVRLPRGFAGPGRLAQIYVIDGIGAHKADVAGTVVLRDLRTVMPGTSARPH